MWASCPCAPCLATRNISAQVGVLEEPKLEDWLWAMAAFWSRAQSLPVPQHHQQQQETSNSSSSSPGVVVLEGLVPGVDFCNHSFQVRAQPHSDVPGTVANPQIEPWCLTETIVCWFGCSCSAYAPSSLEPIFVSPAGNPHATTSSSPPIISKDAGHCCCKLLPIAIAPAVAGPSKQGNSETQMWSKIASACIKVLSLRSGMICVQV